MKIDVAEHILSSVHGKPASQLSDDLVEELRKAHQKFLSYYSSRPQMFLERFITINDGKTNEIIPFKLNRAQLALVAHLDKRFICAPKARQLGITTLTNALALHHAIFVKSAHVICMSVNSKKAEGNLKIINKMRTTMPKWVQQLLIYCDDASSGEHANNMSRLEFKSKATKTEVSIQTASANAEAATRGSTPTFLHWTETAFAEQAQEIFTSVYPGLSRKDGSMIILESTGNGNSGFFYDVAIGVKKGFEVIFLPWHYEEDYRKPTEPFTEVEDDYFMELMGIREIPSYLDDEQKAWYRDNSETLGKGKCQQEYPLSVEQVFQATSNSFFSSAAIRSVEKLLPVRQLSFSSGLLEQKPSGYGKVYEEPKPNYEYILSCDPCQGVTETGDYCSINAIDPDGHEVLSWYEQLDPDQIVNILHALAKFYNDALVVVESNGIGDYVLMTLQKVRFYTNIYSHKPHRLGFYTTMITKPLMCATLQNMMASGKMIFRNTILPLEMQVFEADTLRAQKHAHDDSVVSAAIAALVFEERPPLRKITPEHYRVIQHDEWKQPKAVFC